MRQHSVAALTKKPTKFPTKFPTKEDQRGFAKCPRRRTAGELIVQASHRYYAARMPQRGSTCLAPEGQHENSPGQASETSAALGN
jgi:hypothetical protein